VDVLHHVKDATAYPATLLTAAANDPRVSVWQPAKLAAALQAANVGGRPVLLRVDADAPGQGGPTRRENELLADQLAFMLWQMEDPQS
jgi:prolyl oligopeptidase